METNFKNTIKLVSLNIATKWKASGKRADRFRTKYEEWLKSEDIVFKLDLGDIYSLEEPSTSRTTGRPTKIFGESSEKTKKRRVQKIVEGSNVEEITVAAEVILRKSGKRDAANLIKDISTAPETASDIKKIRAYVEKQRSLTPDEALAWYVDTKSTSHGYKLTRKVAMAAGHYSWASGYYRLHPHKPSHSSRDSGYPLRPWLMTPYLPQPAPGTPEFRFNERMRQIRVLIERTFGELKNRFRCLLKDRVLHYAPVTVGKIVMACTVLHNICVENNIPLILDDNEDYVNEGIDNFENNLQEERGLAINNIFARGQQIRNFFVQSIFLTN
ncbi:hypothetical protein NQ315_007967 [Exocentrus adspersus]|uniref:DDE Tnp4 domain-containing protein n=1 Tax=Exocentrus adspersus TaxID=1586481 RepID=A0AAV8V745_9CUCU|nr:hypothetical protein NQ315_007967 [Exocentrus adspersus]